MFDHERPTVLWSTTCRKNRLSWAICGFQQSQPPDSPILPPRQRADNSRPFRTTTLLSGSSIAWPPSPFLRTHPTRCRATRERLPWARNVKPARLAYCAVQGAAASLWRPWVKLRSLGTYVRDVLVFQRSLWPKSSLDPLLREPNLIVE
jgi:hypothetical protein